jgi:hypothetical protein
MPERRGQAAGMNELEALKSIAGSLQCIAAMFLALVFMYFVGWNKK